MTPFLGELIGTALLILLGNGTVANVLLNKTKGNNGGWIVITVGWGMSVFVAVYTVASISGAHLNPAVTIAFAFAQKISWELVPIYILAQMIGAMIGSSIVWITYKQHFDATENKELKLSVFCTAPAIRSTLHNFITEVIATFVLIFGILHIAAPQNSLGALDAIPVALLIFGIGLSLGGPTGYAINPARDLGPRIMHFILPIVNKRDSDWGYAWIPIIAPIVGALLAVVVFQIM
jgi:glycerol uptake facilitator protein